MLRLGSVFALLLAALHGVAAQYLIGVGIGDITGPVVETNMMGYADLSQTDTGIHMRQRSRAFIVANPSNTAQRVLLINSDISCGDTGIRRAIISRLQTLYPGVYTYSNVAIVGTHAHSGVGGFMENLLPQITSLGFVKETFDAIVAGTVAAVQRAHTNLATGTISIGSSTILNANINRSGYSYLANPASERARYAYDQDKDQTIVKFTGSDGKAKGLLSFFAVHGTSLYQNNTLVSGDNKGMAAYLYESYVEPSAEPGKTSFVAGFVQSNVGDSSPNTLGAFCEAPGKSYHGQACDFATSVCGTTAQECHGRGPGFRVSDFESNYLIGSYQFQAAKSVMEGSSLTALSGAVRSFHIFVDMSNYQFTLANGTSVHTCPAALGYSFAGGTTDGPGAFDFTQGDNSTSQNPLWEIVKGAVTPAPSDAQKACQAPKPILLNTGYATTPYNWSPSILPVQAFRIGQLVILIVPGEFTTMAGRRLREAVRAKLIADGIIGSNAVVVIAGPSNAYGHYVTTREEYGIQRYEGASTLYGPFTAEAYSNIYLGLLQYLADGATSSPPAGPSPPDLTGSPLSLRTGVVLDSAPIGQSFGSVLISPSSSYSRGQTVIAQFTGANPRNNLRLDGTFLSVDRLIGSTWSTYRTDSHPSTTYRWTRTNTILGYSTVNVTWNIESDAPAGSYRIRYFGDSKSLFGTISAFTGTTATFTVA